jgi:hypothetical protein
MRWVNRHMRRNDRMIAGAVPILALLVLYLVMAAQRHALNPGDKILPLPDAMARGLSALLFQADPLSGTSCSGPIPSPASNGSASAWRLRRCRRWSRVSCWACCRRCAPRSGRW